MKRDEVRADTDYLTTQGQHVRVLDTWPGWAVRDGEWVEAKAMGRRYVKGKGWMEYQSNYAIRAELIDAEGWAIENLVLHPRVLVRKWRVSDETKVAKAAQAADSSVVWARRLRRKGLTGVKVSPDNKHVTVTLASLARALEIEEDA